MYLPEKELFVYVILDEDGKRISNYVKIEIDEKSGYCYCAIYETDEGDILLGYCAGAVSDGSCLARVRIRKIYKSDFGII